VDIWSKIKPILIEIHKKQPKFQSKPRVCHVKIHPKTGQNAPKTPQNLKKFLF
jgi:hypothetical protein